MTTTRTIARDEATAYRLGRYDYGRKGQAWLWSAADFPGLRTCDRLRYAYWWGWAEVRREIEG